jgi:hypothetical protein
VSTLPVKVKADIDTEGNVKPKTITYEDEEYPVDRIIQTLPLNALKSGGGKDGYWYKCAVGGRVVFLIYDGVSHKWQMELPAA